MTGNFADRGWLYSQATWWSASRFHREGVSEWLASLRRCAPVPPLGLLCSPVAELIGGGTAHEGYRARRGGRLLPNRKGLICRS